MSNDAETRAIAPTWLWVAAIGITYFAWLGFFPLAEPDEARYAEIPREMLELSDWITPHLNYVKYFEKPPFLYWLNAATMALAGSSELVVRLWPAVFSVAAMVASAHLARRLYGGLESQLTLLLLATSPLYFGMSQVLLLDAPLAGLMTLCLVALWLGSAATRPAFWMAVAAATAAAAVLTKGPVAILLIGGIIVAFAIWQRDLTMLRRVLSPLPILVFVGLCLPWFIAVQQRNPEFFDFFVVKQHLARYLTPDEHKQPIWFFVPFVVVGVLPWSLVLLFAPRRLWQQVRQAIGGRIAAGTRFCLLWFLVIFVFFSLSGSKLATYILPAFPPLAILVARSLAAILRRNLGRPLALVGCVVAVLGLVLGFGAWVAQHMVEQPQMAVLAPRIYVAAAVLLGGGVIATSYAGSALHATRTLGVVMLAICNIAISGRGVAQTYASLGTFLREAAAPDDLIVMYGHYSQTIPYYSGRRAVMVRAWGELDFGSRQGDQSAYFWRQDSRLIDAWKSPQRLFVVINRTELEPLLAHLEPPPRIVSTWHKKVLIVNFPPR